MVQDSAHWVGIDLHQQSLVLAVYRDMGAQPLLERTLPPESPKLRPLLAKLERQAPVRAVYEASGCGYWLARRLRGWGFACDVIAPSLIPKRSGDRVKTDKRDARKLATLHRGGLLELVRVPTESEERLRGLVRSRDTARRDVHRCRQRVLKLLQARGVSYLEGKHWTHKHWSWLRGLRLEGEDHVVLSHHLADVEVRMAMLDQLDEQVEQRSLEAPYAGPVARLRCLRGIDTLSAMTLATEVFDMRRFASARRFMGWLGLGVAEDTTGKRRRQFNLTRTGNTHCRRILIEAAWNNTHRPYISRALKMRMEGQPPEVLAHAWRAQQRMHRLWERYAPRMNRKTAIAAMARQLSGFVWALWRAEPDMLRRRVS